MSHRLLKRHVGSTVSLAILGVLGVLVGLDVIASVVEELGEQRADYRILQVLTYVALTVPSRLFEFLPFAVLVGGLVGLGQLATNSELVVMRAAGIGVGRILWMSLRPTLLILLLGMLISEYVAPEAERIAQGQKSLAQTGQAEMVSRWGVWHREGDTFMHFNTVQPRGVLYGVTLFSFHRGELQRVLFAERATYQRDFWLLEELTETYLEQGAVQAQQEKTRRWDTELSPRVLTLLVLSPNNMSIEDLYRYAQYRQDQGLGTVDYELAFWRKICQPLAAIGLFLLAASSIFGPLRSVTMGYRIFLGVLIGISFRTSQDLLGPASVVYGFSPIYAVLLPIALCWLLAFVMLRRV